MVTPNMRDMAISFSDGMFVFPFFQLVIVFSETERLDASWRFVIPRRACSALIFGNTQSPPVEFLDYVVYDNLESRFCQGGF
jgi:hypothetical protein